MSPLPHPLPVNLYDAAGCRELDRRAIAERGIAGDVLMERAGCALFQALRRRWPAARQIVVACGTGNNGGDGYVVARLAGQAGLRVEILTLGDPRSATAEAAAAAARAMGVAIMPFTDAPLVGADLIVDALLGTGLTRAPRDDCARAIDALNAAPVPVVAADMPSGLASDTGHAPGAVVRAALTVTFIGLKLGLLTGAGREYAGDIVFDALAVPGEVANGVIPAAQRITEAAIRVTAPRRRWNAHKGDSGHVLVVGGGRGMAGAARLCAEAAARSGAGLVSVATRSGNTAAILAGRPELMVREVDGPLALAPMLARATVVALGPGLGRGAWAQALFDSVVGSAPVLIVDADGLNLLAATPRQRSDWVLTPHPGEAGRLLGCSSAEIQADRPTAAAAISARYGGVCVLKGAGSLVTAADEPLALCDRGNPGMASGGMGDLLTGVIAALRAQRLTASGAARLGVWLHATAGDAVAGRNGVYGMLASDLLGDINQGLNSLCRAPPAIQ